LEDVLQREPREKIDVYDGLGYYFIVFRAIDETYFRYTAPAFISEKMVGGVDPTFSSWSRRMLARAKDRLRRKHNGLSAQDIEALDDPRANDRGRLEIIEDRPGKEGLEGVAVGGLNVYLVVFPDGVVSVSEARDIEGSPVLIASLVYYTPVSLR
jgi:Mg2+ and Co2+ transporter CorA